MTGRVNQARFLPRQRRVLGPHFSKQFLRRAVSEYHALRAGDNTRLRRNDLTQSA